MVQKTFYRGVHSGNTLRAYNSRYSRRYHKEACIVSRVHPQLIEKMNRGAGTEKADKKQAELRNIGVDVALSLNKQARWLLPGALIHQVRSDNIADSELTVSVLERHKLKRPASCVSFHSNRGEVKRIQPKNGRYFGFNFPGPDGVSRRALRRQRKEKLQEQLKMNKAQLKFKTIVGKFVEVFTELGKTKHEVELGETEVRYEVYYPSPASSSISHNPKYIKKDVDTAFNDSDQHVQHGKPRKQHGGKSRKRITLKDIDDWELMACQTQPLPTLKSVTTIVNKEEYSSLCEVKEEQNPTEWLLSSLIDKAQQLQNFKGVSKLRRKKRKASGCQEDDKSHIIYLSQSPEKHTEDAKSDDASSSSLVSSSPVIHPVSPVPSESTRVLLPSNEATVTSLKDCFGESYSEVCCKPRKFIVDVTSSVHDVLKKQGIQARVAERTEKALSYLICIHDGFYDDEYDVYRVLLNTNLHGGLLTVQMNAPEQDLVRCTMLSLISQTMNFVQELITNFEDKNDFPLFLEDQAAKASGHCLNNHLGSSENYVPSVKRMFQKSSAIFDNALPTLADLVQEGPEFCDVCYDDINPLKYESAAFTSLLTCQHHVCDSCWSQHIHTRLYEGFVRLTCPGHDCQEEAKVGMLLSVAPLNTVEKLLKRQEEVRIGASQTEKWCPKKSCGRVIRLCTSSSNDELQFQQDIICACGAHVCFRCLESAHWPASCTQAQEYRAKADTSAFPDRLAEVHDDFKADEQARIKRQTEKASSMFVEGKHCPKCKNFVLKNGGCPQMVCRCGQMFCWFCAKPGTSHPSRGPGCVDAHQERKLTTTMFVNHINNKELDNAEKQHTALASRRQRVSLMERAVECRQHREKKPNISQAITTLSKHVATAAAKNKVLSHHIMKTCTEAFPSRQDSTAYVPGLHTPVLKIVTSFLKNAVHSRQELLEVVEYSLVLLKDLPDSLLRRRALRISDDLGAFCSFSQSVFDVWSKAGWNHAAPLQEAAKAVMRLAEIQGWIRASLDTHVVTVRKLRALNFPRK